MLHHPRASISGFVRCFIHVFSTGLAVLYLVSSEALVSQKTHTVTSVKALKEVLGGGKEPHGENQQEKPGGGLSLQ